jgi:hypothetical protein
LQIYGNQHKDNLVNVHTTTPPMIGILHFYTDLQLKDQLQSIHHHKQSMFHQSKDKFVNKMLFEIFFNNLVRFKEFIYYNNQMKKIWH